MWITIKVVSASQCLVFWGLGGVGRTVLQCKMGLPSVEWIHSTHIPTQYKIIWQLPRYSLSLIGLGPSYPRGPAGDVPRELPQLVLDAKRPQHAAHQPTRQRLCCRQLVPKHHQTIKLWNLFSVSLKRLIGINNLPISVHKLGFV